MLFGQSADPSFASKIASQVPESPLTWPIRIGRLLGAWLCVATGIAFMIQAGLGTAPIDSLIKGLSDTTGWNFGVVFIGVSVAFYAIGWALGSPPGPASLAGSFVIGPGIDLMLGVVSKPSALAVRIALFVLGLLLVALGICLVITTNLGPGPSEVLMLGLHRKGIPLVASRWVIDATHLAIGFAFGGPIGIGTGVFLVAMGPMIKYGLGRLNFV